MYIQGECLVKLNGPRIKKGINKCSIVKVIHVYKKINFSTYYKYAHLQFGTTDEVSKFFNTYAMNMNIFCLLLPINAHVIKKNTNEGTVVIIFPTLFIISLK